MLYYAVVEEVVIRGIGGMPFSVWQWEQTSQIARFMGPTWGPSGAGKTQVSLVLATWICCLGLSNSLARLIVPDCPTSSALVQYENVVLPV